MKSANDRQKDYRIKHTRNGARRLDVMLSPEVGHYLEAMALHGNKTKKQVISELLEREYLQLLNDPSSGLDDFLKVLHGNG